MSASIEPINAHNLLNNNNAIPEEEDQFSEELTRKCSIDIHGQPVSSDILVALLDRPAEMKQLVARNFQFYEALKYYISETQGQQAWKKFEDIVNKPRQKLPDRCWINQISQYLAHNPVFLSKFKETVGFEDDTEDQNQYVSSSSLPSSYKMTSSSSTGSNGTRRSSRTRRLSSMSLGDVFDYHDDDTILEEDAPKVPDGMFSNEDHFYQQQNMRRRRSSYHSIQSEPHPTSVGSKIDEVDEERQDNNDQGGDESDHLSELLEDDDDSSDDDTDINYQNRAKDIGAGYSAYHRTTRNYNDMDLIKLREHPDFQANLAHTHPAFFRKAKQLLSLGSAHHFSATIRRNSILEDAMPPSPVTELEEPRFQTCCSEEPGEAEGNLTRLICSTRRKQPDDVAWLNGVMEALSGWPELVDRLHVIINESLVE